MRKKDKIIYTTIRLMQGEYKPEQAILAMRELKEMAKVYNVEVKLSDNVDKLSEELMSFTKNGNGYLVTIPALYNALRIRFKIDHRKV
jgi:hypothetical protein